MNNEYPNGYPQGGQDYNAVPPSTEPIPEVVVTPVQQAYYQPDPIYPPQPTYQAQPDYQAQPNYQTPPANSYPNQQPYTPPAGYYNYNQPGYYAPVPEEKPAAVWKVFAILGLVFGILGLVFCWIPFFCVISIMAIVFSAMGKKSRSGVATAGLVTSIIGTVFGLIFTAALAETFYFLY